MPRKSSNVVESTPATLWVKVKPADAKITLRLDEPENQTGQFEEISSSKIARVVKLINGFEDANGVKKYGYILNVLTSGERSYQRVAANALIHLPLLEVLKGKKAGASILEARTAKPKATKTTKKAPRKTGRKTSRKNAAAKGGEDMEDMIRRIIKQMQEA